MLCITIPSSSFPYHHTAYCRTCHKTPKNVIFTPSKSTFRAMMALYGYTHNKNTGSLLPTAVLFLIKLLCQYRALGLWTCK